MFERCDACADHCSGCIQVPTKKLSWSLCRYNHQNNRSSNTVHLIEIWDTRCEDKSLWKSRCIVVANIRFRMPTLAYPSFY